VAEDGIETPIGVVPANGAEGPVEVLVRPELVALALDADGAGEVVGREFRGHDVFYRVRVNGLEVVSQRPSNELVPLGARVSVHFHDGRVAVLS
jgi:iron(III) transport system ATP-binding protein